jgi:hypothetical protein
MTGDKSKKTWARELSVLLMIFLGYLALEGKVPELEILAWPFTLFAFGAFGFKQPEVKDRIRGIRPTYEGQDK